MMTMKKITFPLILLVLTACGENKEVQPAEEATAVAVAENVIDSIQVDAITSATSKPNQVSFNGTMVIPPQRMATVSLTMGGVIKSTSLLPGEPVRQGSVLATLENPDFITLQQTYLDSHAQTEFLEAEYLRQQALSAEQAASQKKLQQSKADYLSMKSRVQCPKFWKFVCDVFSALIFPGMLILFIGCELHYSYYERALPYCLAVGLFLLALTTASYFLYDPYRSARRRVGDAKSMIRSIERSAKKQVKKNQKQQAKEELRQDRLQKKESEKLLKIQQKQEVRLEKQGKRLQKWETWKQQFLERFQKSEDIVDEEVSDETLPDAAAGDETLPEEAVVDEALRKETVVDEALPKETVGNEALPAESGEEDPDDPHI